MLITQRLKLREFKIIDAEGFYNLNNDPEVLKYTGDDPFISINQAREFIIKYKLQNYLMIPLKK